MNEAMERYYWLKEHGFCVHCGHEPARKGRVTCAMCGKTMSEQSAIWHANHPRSGEDENKKQMQRCKNRYATLKEAGLCTRCGKRKADKGSLCDWCRAKHNERQKELRRCR